MKMTLTLRSAGSAFAAALVACSSGTTGASGDTPLITASGGTGGSGVSGAPVAAAGGSVSASGSSSCSAASPGSINDVSQPADWASWYTTHDATPGAVQMPTGTLMGELFPGTQNYAAHTTGNGFIDWGAGLALSLTSARTCLDFAKFTGIKFRAKGPANLIVAAQVPGVLPVTSGGTCASNCYDSHKTTVTVGSDFSEHTLYWSQFVQAGWGTPVTFLSSAVTLFDFEVGPTDMPFDFWIDDVSFVDTPPPTSGTGAGGSAGVSGGGGAAGAPTSGGAAGVPLNPMRNFGDVLSEAQFNQMFPNRNPFYSYSGLVAAATKYALFAAVGDLPTQKREVAAFLANVARETASLKFIDELSPSSNYCDTQNTTYKCVAGQDYHGRGPLQISWNYNYGAAGVALGANLLTNPGLVASDATIAWETALWFWMTVTSGGRTAHTVMAQNAGFGLTIRVINGQIECNGGNSQAVNDRIAFYQRFCAQLGVPSGENLTC